MRSPPAAELTPEVKAENDKRFSRLEKIKETLDNQMKFAKLALEKGEVTGPVEVPGKKEAEGSEQCATAIDRAEFSRAATAWAASGNMSQKFATITTATQSSIYLPVEVAQPLVPVAINTFRQAYALYGMTVMSTATTNKIDIPVLTPSAGGQVAENATTETENESGLTESIISQPKTYHSGTNWFSNNQLAALDFDLVATYTPSFLGNKELGLEAVIAAGIIADSNITQSVTTSSPTAFTYSDLVSLDQSLPKRFQSYKVIVLSQTAYAQACALTFASGPAVLTTDNNGLKRFNGVPVLRSDSFQALAATNVIGAIFSLSGFHLRDAGQVKVIRYTQVPSKPDQSGFDLVHYHAYGYSPAAIALFKAHA